jgi:radical SAM protein with 4Fe4S-binding SPASM domain
MESRDLVNQNPMAQEQLVDLFRRFSSVPQLELIPKPAVYPSAEHLVARYLAGEAGPGRDEPATCNYMLHNPHIKESGDVFPCCGLSEDRAIGNILKEPLGEILERHHTKYSWHTSLSFPSCQHCIFYSHYNPSAPKLTREASHPNNPMPKAKPVIPILPVY